MIVRLGGFSIEEGYGAGTGYELLARLEYCGRLSVFRVLYARDDWRTAGTITFGGERVGIGWVIIGGPIGGAIGGTPVVVVVVIAVCGGGSRGYGAGLGDASYSNMTGCFFFFL